MVSYYLNNLYNQFMQAKGYSSIHYSSVYMTDEFEHWLIDNQAAIDLYREILKYEDININDFKTAEIGKGGLDTVVKPNSDTILITPYDYTFENINEYNINKGYLYVDGNSSKIVEENPIAINNRANKELDEAEGFNYFITHNPYDYRTIKYLKNAHESGQSISVAMIGNKNDKDRNKKETYLSQLRDDLIIDIKDGSFVVGDFYVDIIASDRDYKSYIKRKY